MSPEVQLPERIGPYEVLKVLGQGGLATVYLAQQNQPFKRQVAVKLIRLGMETQEILERFALERQALAMMNHPNIAKVFDAGQTETGRSYFVMECVFGKPITEHCDEQELSVKERLSLFAMVCRAVQYAHQKGIIHRDIKPTNVLVTRQDGKDVPVVIDFGLAKAIDENLMDAAVLTRQGQLVGTPRYMSPEQIERPAADIDTRSDVYSLGVLLYEMLVGVPPHERNFSYKDVPSFLEGVQREEPTKPSTRLFKLAGKAPDVARHRGTDEKGLLHEISGDLDWIALKALEKDRERRYATASELASDVERFLRGEPVLARPPSAIYRVRRFVARHRIAVAVGLALALATIAGSVSSTFWYVRANRIRAQGDRLIDVCESVRNEAANAHLWLEEVLAGDKTLDVQRDVQDVFMHLEAKVEAARSATMPSWPGGMDGRLRSLAEQLRLLISISEERWAKRDGEGRVGAALDQDFDRHYLQVLQLTGAIVSDLERRASADWKRAAQISTSVNFIALLFLLGSLMLALRIWSKDASRG